MDKFKFILKEKISRLPKATGIYLFKDKKGLVLYIGKAANLKERIKNHFQRLAFRDNLFIGQVAKIGYLANGSEIEALILEANLIKKYRPKYNVMWKDDKNYFYVAITREQFPQIFLTHQIKLKTHLRPELRSRENAKFKTNFVGPFVDGHALKQTLKILRKAFPFRTCRHLPKKPCLWYQLNRCPAPCLTNKNLAKEIPTLEKKLEKETKVNTRNVAKILKGEKSKVLAKLKGEMKKLARKKEFEKAGKIRDQIQALERILAHSHIFEPSAEPPENWIKTQNILKKLLGSQRDISKIEAYDVSNIQGQLATGAMAVFTDGRPNKSFYRKFKIKYANSARSAKASRNANAHTRIGKPDDVAMLKEILARRFSHKEWLYPELILIDGGKAQLNAAKLITKNYRLKTKVAALAKRQNELFIEGRAKPILLKNLPREIFNLILQLRDEAHRFALTYHKKLRRIDLLGQN